MTRAQAPTIRPPFATLLPLLATIAAILLSPIPAAAAQKTYTHRSRHYEIITDLDRNSLREIATHMDAVAEEYAHLLSSFAVKNSMRNRLYVFQSRDSYLDFMGEFGFDARNTGGVFFVQQGQSGLATWTDARSRSRMYHVLQHEGFHQFANARIGRELPTWANEGLAEYFGHALIVRGKLQTGLAPGTRLEQLKRAIRNDRFFSFEELVGMPHDRWNAVLQSGDRRAGLMYSQAWSMVHFLVHAEDGRFARAFEHYIRAMSQGKNNDQALEEAFGGSDLDAFEKAWKNYTLELTPDPISVAVERLEFLGAGLELLHDNGVEIDSMNELKHELKSRQFRLTVREHAINRQFSATSDDLFEPPASGTTRRAEIKLKASRFSSHPSRKDLPPMIDVTGLGPHIRLHWSRNEAGDLVSEVSIK